MTAPRRIVTGHDQQGRSVVVNDGAAPKTRSIPGSTFHDIWCTAGAPAPIPPVEPREPTDRPLVVPPDAEGTNLRIIDVEPRSQSPMHRTETIDYAIVLAGTVTLILDDGSETELTAGDIVVQRGTNHAWSNPTDEPAQMAFVLVDARFTPELEALLPPGYELLDGALDE